MVAGLGNVGKIPELRKRLLFTIAMLAVYRFGVYVSTPGIDVVSLREQFQAASQSLFGLINMFSGGAFQHFSIFSLGVAPYISVSIIIQVLTPIIPTLAALRKDGDAGRRVITRYTRQGTILLALLQSYFISVGLESQRVVLEPGIIFRLNTMITLTAGTAFIMWLGEQITERGLGNGISVLIFAGIVARMPAALGETFALSRTGDLGPLAVIGLLLFALATVYFIVFVERSLRKIPVQYPRRMVGKRLAQAQTQYMPFKVNLTGVIPPIFASAFLGLPVMMLNFVPNEKVQDYLQYLHPGRWPYETIYVGLIFLMAFFYVSILYEPEQLADNLKKNGGFIPSVRPGKPTADYIYGVLNRLTLWGALYMAAVCVVPQLIYISMGTLTFASVFGGTAILIVVGVTLDTAAQIESMVVARNYEAFMSKSAKVRGGIGSMAYSRSRLLRR